MQLLFIHGSGGCREAWQYQTDYFNGSEAVNLPGHPEGQLKSTVEGYAGWLHEYVQRKNYHDLVLVGHSLGGAIALRYALDYPEDLKAIVMVGSGARLRVHPDFIKMLEKAANDTASWEGGLSAGYDRINPELTDIIKKRDAENTPAAFINDLKACDQFDVMEELAKVTIPILALCGDEDVMTPPKYSKFMEEKTPQAKAVVIPGGTHFVFAEKPAAVNQAIDAFLKQLS